MSIKRSIVIGEPKVASTSKDTKRKVLRRGTTIKRKVAKEALTPMGIVRDKSCAPTNVRATRATGNHAYIIPDGKVLVIVGVSY